MVTKSRKANPGKKKKIKVLKLDKETIKDLTKDQAREIKGASLFSVVGCCLKATVVGCCLDTVTAGH